MSAERLRHIGDMLESDDPLPAASRQWLREALRRWASGLDIAAALQLDASNARRERDKLLQSHAHTLPCSTTSARARFMAEQARRIHSGRKTAYPWIQRADKLHRLPETSRQYFNLLK